MNTHRHLLNRVIFQLVPTAIAANASVHSAEASAASARHSKRSANAVEAGTEASFRSARAGEKSAEAASRSARAGERSAIAGIRSATAAERAERKATEELPRIANSGDVSRLGPSNRRRIEKNKPMGIQSFSDRGEYNGGCKGLRWD